MKRILILIAVSLALACNCFASGVFNKSAVVAANSTMSDAVTVLPGGYCNFRIDADTSPVMVIFAQCRYRAETTWYNLKRWTLPNTDTVDIIYTVPQSMAEYTQFRMGSNSTGYTSGNCTVRVGTGRVY